MSVAGDTIKVNPGTYEENVIVDKQLTILGPDPANGKAENPAFAAIVDPIPTLAVPDGSPAFAFYLNATGIKIKGFTIGEIDGLADLDGSVGVGTSNVYSAYQIVDNVIENNTIGISVNTATTADVAQTYIFKNLIRNNNAPGAAAGNGIYSGRRCAEPEDCRQHV